MATAPCQLQAQVNDFTKSYSNPDIKSMDTSASSSPLVPRRLRTDSTRSYESSLDKVSDDQREKDARSLLRKSPKKDESGHHNGEAAGDADHEDELIKRRSASIMEVREHANTRLSEELFKAQKELMLKDEQCKKLAHVQEQMSTELEELTAKLFEEANKMVQDANLKRIQAEKLLKESNSKIDVLQAEVTALKTLVITSTPSMPNRHLHPQIEVKKKEGGPVASVTSFIKGHRRSTSHHNFTKEIAPVDISIVPGIPAQENKEVDPYFFDLFKNWRESSPKMLDQASPFLNFIINGDIMPCLAFSNTELSQAVFRSILNNTLTIEPDQEKNPFPRPCSLTKTTRVCKYRIRLGDGVPWHVISQVARNRVTAVCDFITYIRYITQGLVKSENAEIYWEIIRLRKQVCLSTLGLS